MIEAPSTNPLDPKELAADLLAAAGPSIDNKLALLQAVIDAMAELFDLSCTGDVLQAVADIAPDQLAAYCAREAKLFGRLLSIEGSSETLTAVMRRVRRAYRVDDEPTDDAQGG